MTQPAPQPRPAEDPALPAGQAAPPGTAPPPLPGPDEPTPLPFAAADLNVAGPAAEEERPVVHGHTCGLFAVLDLCEQAHRDVTGRALCLSDADLRTQEIRDHLDECAVCLRWYRNARRAYERLAGQGGVPAPVGPYEPRARVPYPIKQLAAAAAPGDVVLQGLCPEAGGGPLDALALLLEWTREEARGKRGRSRWWLTLKFMARENYPEGNDGAVLVSYDGLRVRLECQARGQPERSPTITRLGLDPQGNLVSAPRSVEIRHPDDLETVLLNPLDRVKSLDGD